LADSVAKVKNAVRSISRKSTKRAIIADRRIPQNEAAQLRPVGYLIHGLRVSSILICHLPKPAKQVLFVGFTDLEIGSAAKRYRTSMAKYFPKPLRKIKRQCHETSNFGHNDPRGRASKLLD
jgi:hypothetical protein